MVNGQREDANNFQLDGVANVSLGGNTLQARPNVDAVEEFKIQTSNFSAEFGRNSGSVVQVVTKSGTNNSAATPGSSSPRQFQSADYFLSSPIASRRHSSRTSSARPSAARSGAATARSSSAPSKASG